MNTHIPTGKDYPIASAQGTGTVLTTQGSSEGSAGMSDTPGQAESRYNTRSTRSGGGMQNESSYSSMTGQSGEGGLTGGSSDTMGTGSQSMGSMTNSQMARDAEGTAERDFNSQSKGMSGRLGQETGKMSSSGQKTAGSATEDAEEEEGGFMDKVKKTLGI